MGFLSKAFAPVIGETVKGIGEGIGGLAIKLRTAITGVDPAQKFELEKLSMEMEALGARAQNDVNMIEAKHTSVFVAGWRPFVGWVCGFGLAWQFIIMPLLNWLLYLYSTMSGVTVVPAPTLPIADLITLLVGMLGFGYMRSKDKQNNTQGNH